jgi:thiol-disulfide isomerase/thioredoxin
MPVGPEAGAFRRAALLGIGAGMLWSLALARPALAVRYVVPAIPPDLDGLRNQALNQPDGSVTTLGAAAPAGWAAIISFWASWCAPCLLEARHLAQVRARIPEARLSIVGINADRTPDEGRISDFLTRAAANFTQLRNGRDAYRAFGGPGNMELPRLFVFDRSGRPIGAYGHYDSASDVELDQAVARALG